MRVTQQPRPTKALWLTIQWGESDVAGLVAPIRQPEALILFHYLKKPLISMVTLNLSKNRVGRVHGYHLSLPRISHVPRAFESDFAIIS